MRTTLRASVREALPALICVFLVGAVCSALGAFNYFATYGNPYAPNPNTVYDGHLVDFGTSDGGTTGWTYARYYGPPQRYFYAQTEGLSYSIGWQRIQWYGPQVGTYVSTGRLFESSLWDWGTSWVETDYPWYMGAIVYH